MIQVSVRHNQRCRSLVHDIVLIVAAEHAGTCTTTVADPCDIITFPSVEQRDAFKADAAKITYLTVE